jgi:hypothetical protein
MPALAKMNEDMRVSQALQVLYLTSKGRTVAEACDEVGITRNIYYRWLREGGDAIDALRTFMVENEREQLGQVLAARQQALDRIVERVEQEPSLDLLLKADQHLRNIQRELEDRHGAHGIDDTAAKEFVLTGPQMHTEQSRLVSVNVTVTEEQPNVVIDVEDAEFEESNE